jgi:L-histidine Nalpha-methyltransferase
MQLSEISTSINHQVTISDFLKAENRDTLVTGIYNDLALRKKSIASRFFYDDRGSFLFEKITTLPEYYATRTEKSILQVIASEIMKNTENLDVIELGSGDCSKISILLDAVPPYKMNQIHYIPVDVSEAAIMKSAEILSYKYPELRIHGILADFIKHLSALPGKGKRLICFFGSTIGNLTRNQSYQFLLNIRNLMHPGDYLLLGLDMVKELQILYAAYNDKQGITADFNKNILNVINNIAETNFDPVFFEHSAFYNSSKSRIEMHLRAEHSMFVTSPLFPQPIYLEKGMTIHTENSHKYTVQDIHAFATITGLEIANIFTDTNRWFSVVQFKRMN